MFETLHLGLGDQFNLGLGGTCLDRQDWGETRAEMKEHAAMVLQA